MIGEGIFTMEFVNTLDKFTHLDAAKNACNEVIEQSTAKDSNKQKARQLVYKSRTVRELMHGAANFSLSFQGLKVIK